jgi:hypothetical protein
MIVLYGEKILVSRFDPALFSEELAFGTMPVSAGVVGYTEMSAVVALIHMTAQISAPAHLDGAHGTQLIEGQPVKLSVFRAISPEYVGYFGPSWGLPHPWLG